ncbi:MULTISPECIES: DUF3963 domain-containing protein [Bacillus]|uniref:DUF3963 domain-containing protein n=2 Tax=Bacillus cereus group TaxID=86661 RepID=A0A2A7D3C1_BACAN|nr:MULTISPECIES: DUF3963 domain-containing protein [Bacillus]MCP1164548.1 DUF3963 domain-containing protein [Bacillus sp. 1813sda1]MDC7971465.1 DUF3963 domain-containing protein [Bacillus sp. BLCC-B18]OTW71073.1 hypothetical protein BK707_09615 [Bacillus thuringiensis serovar coreanensis]OTX41536.1 hypothetical protein BK724_30180 [Bacillus thuringiensis serovar sooncheon]OTX47538.1 hypothetical protein BK725_29115 [Bacillus thuringiensis serovar guiyangiensis]
MNKKRIFELFIVTLVFLFLHVSTFTNEKFNDKFGSFTFIVLLLMLSIYTAFIEKYFDDIQKWIRNITFCFALLVVAVVALWIGYF